MKNFTKSRFGTWLIVWILTIYARLVWWTGRWQIVGKEHMDRLRQNKQSFVLVLWHGRMLMSPMAVDAHKYPMHVLASKHGDGQIAVQWAEKFGFRFVRGSSSEGGSAALKEMRRIAKSGESLVITPDGPQGPRMIAKNGVCAVSEINKLPVIAMSYSTRGGKNLKNWDRTLLPGLFTRGVITFSAPVPAPANREPEVMEASRQQIETALLETQYLADDLASRERVEPASATEIEKFNKKQAAKRQRQKAAETSDQGHASP